MKVSFCYKKNSFLPESKPLEQQDRCTQLQVSGGMQKLKIAKDYYNKKKFLFESLLMIIFLTNVLLMTPL